MDALFNLDTLVALQNLLTALGALVVAAKPVHLAFRALAKLTPFKWDDKVADVLGKALGLFTPKAK